MKFVENKISKLIENIEFLSEKELEDLINTFEIEVQKVELSNRKKATLIGELEKI